MIKDCPIFNVGDVVELVPDRIDDSEVLAKCIGKRYTVQTVTIRPLRDQSSLTLKGKGPHGELDESYYMWRFRLAKPALVCEND